MVVNKVKKQFKNFLMMLKDSAIIAEGFLKIQKQKFTEEEYLFLMKDIMDNQVDQD